MIIHFVVSPGYGLHRDEYLYYEQGAHLAWGYYEVPPITALIGRLARILGGEIWAIRSMPALAGALIISLGCHIAYLLSRDRSAMIITGISMMLSPSILGSTHMYMPVAFNQVCWLLIAYAVIKIIKDPSRKNYVFLGVFIGLGLLTKYSVVFYLVALILALGFSSHRKLLIRKEMIWTIGIVVALFLPNLIWQIRHGTPVIRHMQELSETQLVHMDLGTYFSGQLLYHVGFAVIWMIGLVACFAHEPLRKYRAVAVASVICVTLIGLLSGKAYYPLGSYLILFPMAGVFLSYRRTTKIWSVLILFLAFLLTLPFYPFALPILPIDNLKAYCVDLKEQYGLDHMLRWEDGSIHELPQDVADCHGWEEIAKKVSNLYHSHSDQDKQRIMILAGSYGHAGALDYYEQKYDLPESHSLSGSNVFWAEKDIDYDIQIMIDDRRHDGSSWFENLPMVDSLMGHLYARDPGYIYYRTAPKTDVSAAWRELVEETRGY